MMLSIKILKKIVKSYILLTFATLCILSSCSSHKMSVKRERNRETIAITDPKKHHNNGIHLTKEEELIIEEAMTWMHTPYAYGRQDKGLATDCSGMVMRVFEATIACKLPRNSAKQADFCEEISSKHVKPGDLVFFITNKGNKINHVGIMIDELQFIHASSHGVVISSMDTEYYRKNFQKYGRVPCVKH